MVQDASICTPKQNIYANSNNLSKIISDKIIYQFQRLTIRLDSKNYLIFTLMRCPMFQIFLKSIAPRKGIYIEINIFNFLIK
jgi:hypothetical protein